MSSSPPPHYTIRLAALPPSIVSQKDLFSLFNQEDAALITGASIAPDPLANTLSFVATVTFARVPGFASRKGGRLPIVDFDEDLYGLTPLNYVEDQNLEAEYV